jgi:hypothetical protein
MSQHKVLSTLVVNSDSFIAMPLTSQALYFHLIMNAEDNFQVRCPNAIKRMLSASDEDLKNLYDSNFIELIDEETFIHSKFRPYDITKRPNWNRWKELRLSIFRRDNYICGYCGKHTENPECDHIIPISRGGDSGYDNLITACKKCNRSKSNKLHWSAK